MYAQLYHTSHAKILGTISTGPNNLEVAPGSYINCEEFSVAKSKKVNQSKSITNTIGVIEQLVRADLIGSMCLESLEKFWWISCLTDAFSRLTHVTILKVETPGEVLAHL